MSEQISDTALFVAAAQKHDRDDLISSAYPNFDITIPLTYVSHQEALAAQAEMDRECEVTDEVLDVALDAYNQNYDCRLCTASSFAMKKAIEAVFKARAKRGAE